MVSIGTNFFYTRSLPCSLWFFDRGRPQDRKHQTLMLDARNVYRVISRKIRDFSDEQLANLTAIVWLYRRQTDRYLALVRGYLQASQDAAASLSDALAKLENPNEKLTKCLQELLAGAPDDADEGALASLKTTTTERGEALESLATALAELLSDLAGWVAQQGGAIPATNDGQVARHGSFQPFVERLGLLRRQVNEVHKLTARAFDTARRELRSTKWDAWDGREIGKQLEVLDEAR